MIIKIPAKIRGIYIFYFCMVAVLPIYYTYWFWRFTGGKDNSIFYQQRKFTITENYLEARLNDGSLDKLHWQNVLRIKRIPEGYLLYVSKTQFIYVPKSILKDLRILKFLMIL